MNISNHLLQPPLDIQVKPVKLSSSLKQAGITALTQKDPSKLTPLPPDNLIPEDSIYQSEFKSLNLPFKPSHKREIEISTSARRQANDSQINPPHFFLKHESKSELKLHRNLELPTHLSPVPSLVSFSSATPNSIKFRLNFLGSPQPITCKSGFLPKLDKFEIVQPIHRTVVIDLDETLIHSSPLNKTPDHIITTLLPDGSSLCLKVSIRPYAKEFLRNVAGLADVVIFTASVKNYADPIIDLLDTERKFVKMRLYRESCVLTEQGYVKDLTVLRKPLKDVIIIDNLASSFSKQKENGLLISSWYGDREDKELYKLSKSMRKILAYDDVRRSDKNFQIVY